VISFRYHVFTIVAIFLAIGLGVVAGTTVIDQGLVKNLKNQTEALRQDLGDVRGQVDDLKRQIHGLDGFATAVFPYVAPDNLPLQKVVIVTLDGVEGSLLEQTRSALTAAGAQIVAELSVQPRMASTDPDVEQQLATALGVTVPTDGSLSLTAARALALRLATAPSLDPAPSGPDVLQSLLEGGFLVARGPGVSNKTPEEIGGSEQIVVVLAGGPADPSIEPGSFAVPLVQELVSSGMPVAAGEPTRTTYPFVEELRSNGTSDGSMVTVDDLDQTMGGLALVLGLHDLVQLNTGGDFGVKAGAAGLLPNPKA